jgi:hypothetical protein
MSKRSSRDEPAAAAGGPAKVQHVGGEDDASTAAHAAADDETQLEEGEEEEEENQAAPVKAVVPVQRSVLSSGEEILQICKAALPPDLQTVESQHFSDRRLTGVIVVVNEFEWCVALQFLEIRALFHLPSLSNLVSYLCGFKDVADSHQLLLVRLPNAGGSSGGFGTHAIVKGVLDSWSPRFVVTIGCAGGWDAAKHKKADVLFSTLVVPYSYRKGAENRNETFLVHHALTTMIHNVVQGRLWQSEKVRATDEAEAVMCNVHEGAILSGDLLVVTDEDKKQMQDLVAKITEDGKIKVGAHSLIGAEMEGNGIAVACMLEQIPNAICKGVRLLRRQGRADARREARCSGSRFLCRVRPLPCCLRASPAVGCAASVLAACAVFR